MTLRPTLYARFLATGGQSEGPRKGKRLNEATGRVIAARAQPEPSERLPAI
jgi:hypothetical protein